MKKLSRLMMVSFIGVLLGGVFLAPADARGPSYTKLEMHGWSCFPAGPFNWVHCVNPADTDFDRVAISVKVFDDETGDFLGTEQLIHELVYHGQPCPQDGLEEYEIVEDTPYMACHHFTRPEE